MINLNKARKILIVRLSSLGDILLTTPLISEIKLNYPQVEIDFLLKPHYADVYKFNSHVSHLMLYEKSNLKSLKKLIKENHYDAVVDLQNNLRTKLLLCFLSVPKLKFKKPSLKKFLLVKFKKNYFKEIVPIPQMYANTLNLKLSKEQSLELFNKDGKVENSSQNNVIGFCPGSKHFTKTWLEEYFVELGNILTEKGYKIYLFGGSIEKDKCKLLSERIKNSSDFSNENDLLTTAELMKKCKLIVSNDSALMHLASAIKIPIVAIFGSSVKEFGFEPFNVKHEIMEVKNLDCRPCSHVGRNICPKGHFKCMIEIKPEMVFEKIISMII